MYTKIQLLYPILIVFLVVFLLLWGMYHASGHKIL